MLKLGSVTKVKMLFLVRVFVFNFDLLKVSAAILEKGLLDTEDHFIENVTENWRRNVYLLKIEENTSRDGGQNIYGNTESNLGPFAGF